MLSAFAPAGFFGKIIAKNQTPSLNVRFSAAPSAFIAVAGIEFRINSIFLQQYSD
jgi:hypothetical protein